MFVNLIIYIMLRNGNTKNDYTRDLSIPLIRYTLKFTNLFPYDTRVILQIIMFNGRSLPRLSLRYVLNLFTLEMI